MKATGKLILTALGAAGISGKIAYTAKKSSRSFANEAIENYGEKAAVGLVKGITAALPDMPVMKKEEYFPHNFYVGHNELISSPKRGAKWSLGYSQISIVPDDYLIKQYYIAGYLSFPANVMTGIIDDQKVRAVCLDDGSGRGAVCFAVIDCVGISNTDVRAIRELLRPWAEKNGIAGINISATHCHSAIDTQGIWGDIPKALGNNVKAIRSLHPEDCISGRNPQFMDNLHHSAARVIREAFEDMKKGTLYSRRSSGFVYNRDKRPPDVRFEDIVSFRFVPSDGSRETVLCYGAAHAVALGPKNNRLSSDYIYYAEEEVNKAGKNFIFFQGAELAIATNGSIIPEDEPEGPGYVRYGHAIGRYLVNEDKEEKVSPILNFRAREIFIPSTGPVLALAAKAGLVNNRIVSDGGNLCLVSEIGCLEVGKSLAFALIPGELAPEIALGGAYDEKESYNHTPWNYKPMCEMIDPARSLTVIGLCNDAIGYILPDNDFGSMFAKLHYEESVSAGGKAGSSITTEFEKLASEFTVK